MVPPPKKKKEQLGGKCAIGRFTLKQQKQELGNESAQERMCKKITC